MENRAFLSVFDLKIIACITMLIDHMGVVLFPDSNTCRIIGRIALPIFAYLIAEGCTYTKNKLKRFLTMALFGIGYLAFYYFYTGEIYGSIFITFSFSILLIYILDFLKKVIKKSLLQGILAGAGAVLFTTLVFFINRWVVIDYGFSGFLLPVFVWIFNDKSLKLKALALGLALLSIFDGMGFLQIFCFLALIPLYFYNGKLGRYKLKYVFYIFYPLHILILEGISLLIN